jgi:hypothetical protein
VTATYSVSFTFSPSPSPSATPEPSLTSTQSPYVPYHVPGLLQVIQVYPNPFKDQCTIYYQLSADAELELAVYNVAGEKVKTKQIPAISGKWTISWAGDNNQGARTASGYYILRVSATALQGNQHASQWLRVVELR